MPRGRPSSPHCDSRGYWRTTIAGTFHYLGRDKVAAFRQFARLIEESDSDRPEPAPAFVTGLIAAWVRRFPSDENAYRIATFTRFAASRQLTLTDIDRTTIEDFHGWVAHQTYTRHTKVGRKVIDAKRRYARNTVIDHVRTAVRCLRWAHRKGWISNLPDVPPLGKRRRQARDLPPAKLADILANLPERAGRCLRFIAATGCRPSEATRLRWEQIDLRAELCTLGAHKTANQSGKDRLIYLTSEAIAALPAHRQSGFVFLSRLGKPYTVGGLRSILRRHGAARPYMLRHTFAQVGSEQVSEEELAALMGHSDVATTRMYYEIRAARARTAAQRLTLPQLRDTHGGTGRRKRAAEGEGEEATRTTRQTGDTESAHDSAARRRA